MLSSCPMCVWCVGGNLSSSISSTSQPWCFTPYWGVNWQTWCKLLLVIILIKVGVKRMTPLHSDLSVNEPLQTWLGWLCVQVTTCFWLHSPREFHLCLVGHPFVDTSNKGMWLTSSQESVNLATIVMWHTNHFQPWLTDFHHSAA